MCARNKGYRGKGGRSIRKVSPHILNCKKHAHSNFPPLPPDVKDACPQQLANLGMHLILGAYFERVKLDVIQLSEPAIAQATTRGSHLKFSQLDIHKPIQNFYTIWCTLKAVKQPSDCHTLLRFLKLESLHYPFSHWHMHTCSPNT